MAALIQRRETLVEKLVQTQYDLEFDSFASAPDRLKKSKELKDLQNSYDTLTKSIHVFDPKFGQQDREKNFEMAQERNRQEMQKTCLRIAASMTKLHSRDKPEEFWHKFNQTCEAYHLKARESVLLLHALIGDHHLGLSWYTNHIHYRAETITMQELKLAFYQGFLEANWQTERLMTLMDVRYKPNEDIKSFIHRFSILMQSNEFGWSETGSSRSFLKHVMFYKCPYSVQRIIGDKGPDDFESCAELAEALCKFKGKPIDVPELQPCDLCKGRNHKPKTRIPESLDAPSTSKPKLHCEVHGSCNHETKDCRGNQKRALPQGDSAVKKPRKEPGMCFADGCEEPFTPSHAKECKFRSKNPVFRKIVVEDGDSETPNDFKIEEDYYGDDDLFFCMTQVPHVLHNQPTGFVYAPCHILDHSVLAGIDSMASKSFISPKLAHALQVPLTKVSGKVSLAARGIKTDRIGETPPVSVRIGNRKFNHVFEVLDMGDAVNCVFGIDIFDKAGIALTGVPIEFPGELASMELVRVETDHASESKSPVISAKEQAMSLGEITSIIDTLNKNDSDYLVLYAVYLLKLQDGLQTILAKNQLIIGFCSLPDSQVDIDVGSAQPVNRRQYRVEFRLHSVVDEQIAKWLQAHIIVHALKHSAWNNPLLVVPKRDAAGNSKGWRVCIDPRALNLLIPEINYPLPLIKDIFEAFKGASVFSRLDMVGGFHQFQVNPAHQEVTTFTWKGKQYQFQGAPFGFKHLPAMFQKVLTNLFKECPFVLVYIDDIIIFSENFTQHTIHIKKVLNLLNNANLKLNIEKCLFALQKILVLGYMISSTGIQVCKEKLVQIEDWATPCNGKQIQKHLGFFNYFREMIPLYAKLVAPLEKLRYRDKFEWTHEYQKIYDKLKDILASGLVLSYPDFNEPFQVGTDASNFGIGAVLYQVIQGDTKYVAFASRALHDGEKGYGATKRELLACVFALKHFRYYLFGRHFTLYTDHKALVCIHTQKQTNQMINGWLETLLELDFEVVHRPGILNVLPDAISRIYDADQPNEQNETVLWGIEIVIPSQDMEVDQDEQTLPELRNMLVLRAHLRGHFGSKAMLKDIVSQGHYWLTMKQDIQEVVQSCEDCQRFNIGRRGFFPMTSVHAKLPMDHIAIDLKEYPRTPDGFHYCLVVVDICSRFVWLKALRNKEEKTVAHALWTILAEFGLPRIVQSDNGSEFVNKTMNEMALVSNIDHRLITPYHPQANGSAERMVQSTSQTVYKLLQGRDHEWPLFLPSVQLFNNMKVTNLHGSTPYSLMFARKANEFLDHTVSGHLTPLAEDDLDKRLSYMSAIVYPAVSEYARNTQAGYKKHFAKQRKILKDTFRPGALVFVYNDTRAKKTEERYTGPFIVKGRKANGPYTLVDQTGYEFERAPSSLKLAKPASKGPDVHAEDSLVLNDRRDSDGLAEYLVQWMNTSDTKWVKAQDFNDYTPIRVYFTKKHKAATQDAGESGDGPGSKNLTMPKRSKRV